MTAPTSLTLAEGRQWARRVPSSVLAVGPVVVAVLVVASIWNEPAGYSGDVELVTSWSEFLLGLSFGPVFGGLLLGWFAPRLGAWLMALAVLPWTFGDDTIAETAVWTSLIAWVWIAVVLLDGVLVLRQRSLSEWAPAPSASPVRWRAEHHRGVRLVAAVLLLAAITFGFVRWLDWRGDLRALAERAVPVAATVTESDTFFDSVFVELDGETREFAVNDARDHPVGSTYTVFTDPTGEMDPYGAEDADPAGWAGVGIPIGVGLLLLGLVTVEVGRRRRRLEALAADGGPGVRVLVRPHPIHEGIEVFAVDDLAGKEPFAYLPRLEPLVPRSEAEATGVRGGLQDLRDLLSHVLGVPGRRRADLEGPAEHRFVDDEPEFLEPEPDDELVEATVLGLVRDGSLCVVRIREQGEELVLGSVRPARDSRTVHALWQAAVDRVLRRPSAAPRTTRMKESVEPRYEVPRRRREDPGELSWIARHGLRVAYKTARFGPLALPLIGYFGVRWLLAGEGLGPGVLVPAAFVATFAAWWWGLARGRVLGFPRGLRVTYGWLDHVVLPGEIIEVRRLAHEVVLELEDDEQYGFLAIDVLSEPDRQSELDDIIATVARAREEARAGRLGRWESSWPRRIPSSSTLVGVVVFVAFVLGGF